MDAFDDAEALARLRRRDPRGFEGAYRNYAARLRGFLWRMTRNGDIADDLLQHTFLRLAEKGPELRADSDLQAWLFTVARNAYRDYLRQLPAATYVDGLEILPCPSPDAEARLLLGDVETALGNLKPDDREILLLIGVESLSHDTVSRMLGLEPATVRQRLARARARLLAELERLPQDSLQLTERTLG